MAKFIPKQHRVAKDSVLYKPNGVHTVSELRAMRQVNELWGNDNSSIDNILNALKFEVEPQQPKATRAEIKAQKERERADYKASKK